MAVYSNLTVDQGSDATFTIDVTDTNGGALNLTGYTVAGQIRKSFSSSTAVDFVASVSSALNGEVTLTLSNSVTNGMKAGRYLYDVEITSSGGSKTRVLEGQLEVMAGVTQT
jgi:hypothetical protein